MKEIKTEAIANAPLESVWYTVSKTDAYPEWNPLVLKLEGALKKGNKLDCSIKWSDGKISNYKSKITELKAKNRLSLNMPFHEIAFTRLIFRTLMYPVDRTSTRCIIQLQFKGLGSIFGLKKLEVDLNNSVEDLLTRLKLQSEKNYQAKEANKQKSENNKARNKQKTNTANPGGSSSKKGEKNLTQNPKKTGNNRGDFQQKHQGKGQQSRSKPSFDKSNQQNPKPNKPKNEKNNPN